MNNDINYKDLVYSELEKHKGLHIHILPCSKTDQYVDIIKSNRKYGVEKYYGIAPYTGKQFYIMKEDRVLIINNLKGIHRYLCK